MSFLQCFRMHCRLGGERNRKQRIPVNSITSKLVLKSIYASGSTGPFFADHYLNIWIDSTQVSSRKTDFLSRYLVLSEIRYARKRNWSKTGTGIFCQKFLIFLKSLKSLNKNFYYTLYSLHELSFIEIWTQDGSTSWIIIIEFFFLKSKWQQSKGG